MPNELLFLSDCHLDPRRPEMIRTLARFLEQQDGQVKQVYLLGDIFEAWLGDDDDLAGYQPVITALGRLGRSCELFFLAGNRDFLVGPDFATRVGMDILTEPHVLQLGEQRTVLVHGDSLCTDDHDYQAFRAIVRDPAWQSDFLAKPLAERQQIAAQLRRDSVAAMSQKTTEIMDVNEASVNDFFTQQDADVIVHGHTHRPAVHQYSSGQRRIVLGDWVEEPSYLGWSRAGGFKLVDPRLNTP